jgi:PadR family transcriptional regulator PadR
LSDSSGKYILHNKVPYDTILIERKYKLNTQFKKGLLDLCVLAIIEKKETYGYEIVNLIAETIEISEGTIYPLLKRLTDQGYCLTRLAESKQGGARKYYKLTGLGKKQLETLRSQWQSLSNKVGKLL